MDIVLEALDFSDRIIIPNASPQKGWTSMSGVIELCGEGSCQAAFWGKEIQNFALSHREGFFIFWGKFQGFITDFHFGKENFLYGSHLNALLKKAVIPPVSIKGKTPSEALDEIFSENIPWIKVCAKEGGDPLSFLTKDYENAFDAVSDYLSGENMGFSVFLEGRELFLKVIDGAENPLVIKEGNKTIYEKTLDFSAKKAVFGGWYKKTEEDDGTRLSEAEWKYAEKEKKSGIFRYDTVLSASSPKKAEAELSKLSESFEIKCKTRNIIFEKDYFLGDIVWLEWEEEAQKKQISSVDIWQEKNVYHEEPQFIEYKEV